MLPASRYVEVLRHHYAEAWKGTMRDTEFPTSPHSRLSPLFEILSLPPGFGRDMWTYATVGMSEGMRNPIELHMLSLSASAEVPELLAAVASYHREIGGMRLGDTVDFGKPWIGESPCEHGLLSLPYLDGPTTEIADLGNGARISCYWLLPITRSEVDFKKENGLDALESLFEASGFDYLEPLRRPVV